MRASVVLALVLLAALSAALVSGTDARPLTCIDVTEQYVCVPHENATTNVTNVTLVPVPMINVTLSNGSVLTFQTIDNATLTLLRMLRSGKIAPENITRIDVAPIREWARLEKYVVNVTANESIASLNVSYEPGYKLFYVRLRNATAWKCNGTLGASTWEDWWSEELGPRIHRMIYGRAPVLEGVDILGRNISLTFDGCCLLILLNASTAEIVNATLTLLTSIQVLLDHVVVIDYSNNETASERILSAASLQGELTVCLEANVTLKDISRNMTLNDSLEAFGFEFQATHYSPLLVAVYEGIIIWKYVGIPDRVILESLVESLRKHGLAGIAEYRLLNVTVVARENEKTTIWITLSEGFGDVRVLVSYAFLGKDNETLPGGESNVEAVLCSRWGRNVYAVYGVFVPNGTRYMEVNVTVVSGLLGVSQTWHFSFKVIYEVKRKPEKFPYEIIAGIVGIVLILAFLAWIYRRLRR